MHMCKILSIHNSEQLGCSMQYAIFLPGRCFDRADHLPFLSFHDVVCRTDVGEIKDIIGKPIKYG